MPTNDAAGLSLAAISTFLSGLGYVLQKKGHMIRNAVPEKDRKPIFRYIPWTIGLVCMVTAAGVAVACFSLLDQSKQAPMGALTICWNVLLAGVLLRETVTVLDAICTCLIVGGTILAVTNNSASSHSFHFEEIITLLRDTAVYVYTGVLGPLLLASVVFLEVSVRQGAATWGKWRRAIISIAAPLTGGMSNGFVAYTIKAAITVVSEKEWHQFAQPGVYIYAIIGVLCVLGQVRYLNVGLSSFPALVIVPAFQVGVIGANALAGIVYYHDMRSAPAKQVALFATGAAISLTGIALLRLKAQSPPAAPPQPPKLEEDAATASATPLPVPEDRQLEWSRTVPVGEGSHAGYALAPTDAPPAPSAATAAAAPAHAPHTKSFGGGGAGGTTVGGGGGSHHRPRGMSLRASLPMLIGVPSSAGDDGVSPSVLPPMADAGGAERSALLEADGLLGAGEDAIDARLVTIAIGSPGNRRSRGNTSSYGSVAVSGGTSSTGDGTRRSLPPILASERSPLSPRRVTTGEAGADAAPHLTLAESAVHVGPSAAGASGAAPAAIEIESDPFAARGSDGQAGTRPASVGGGMDATRRPADRWWDTPVMDVPRLVAHAWGAFRSR